MHLAAALVVLWWATPAIADAPPGLNAYRVKLVLYPGDDGVAVAKRLAAMYRGTLEAPVDGEGRFVIALSPAGADLMGRDPAVDRLERADSDIATERVGATAAVATPWKLGNYEYDGSGNIRKIGTDVFVYDTRNRLLLSADASASTVVHRQAYTYDSFGNLATITTARAGQAMISVSSSSNQVSAVSVGSAAESVAYDRSGNMTAYGDATYVYDALNVLTRSTIDNVTRYYVYTANDERIGTVTASNSATRSDWTIRDTAGQVLRRFSRESNGDWQWQEDYIYRGSLMLAAEVPDSAKTRHFHLDHLGTPRLITGNGGAELSRHNYHAFGVEIGPTVTSSATLIPEKKQFTGHERDAQSLDYMHARYYAPYMGRFLSVDPVIDTKNALRNPQMWNRYSYVLNNPVNRLDPDGRLSSPFHILLTYIAARREGFSFRLSAQLAWRNALADIGTQGTPAKQTNQHAMMGLKADMTPQTPAEARQGTAEAIKENKKKNTVDSVARALHIVQDRATPLHQDHPWTGQQSIGTIARHVLGDVFPSPGTIASAYRATVDTLREVKAENGGVPVIPENDEP
jgi:RHS repeat-associated protein